MNLWRLRISMVATLAAIFGLSTLVFGAVMLYFGAFDFITIGIFVVSFNIIQWLIAPYLVGAIYRAKELKREENPHLHDMVDKLSKKSGISTPKLMLAHIPMPNAFAYGSPISGSRIAVTKGLLDTLDNGEVEAVVGHEIGHLKHRDVQVMMVVSFLPALFYFIGYSLMLSGMFGGDRRNQNGSGAIIGIAFMGFSWVLNIFILYMSRLREYYADRHSVSVVDKGASKLSTGLAKIVNASSMRRPKKQEQQNLNSFRALFISDPDPEKARVASESVRAFKNTDRRLVDEILEKKLTFGDKLIEALSTHPNIVKRLRALEKLEQAA